VAKNKQNIHDRQAAARSGYDYGVVHINHVVTWTANQSGLVTLTFDPERGDIFNDLHEPLTLFFKVTAFLKSNISKTVRRTDKVI